MGLGLVACTFTSRCHKKALDECTLCSGATELANNAVGLPLLSMLRNGEQNANG